MTPRLVGCAPAHRDAPNYPPRPAWPPVWRATRHTDTSPPTQLRPPSRRDRGWWATNTQLRVQPIPAHLSKRVWQCDRPTAPSGVFATRRFPSTTRFARTACPRPPAPPARSRCHLGCGCPPPPCRPRHALAGVTRRSARPHQPRFGLAKSRRRQESSLTATHESHPPPSRDARPRAQTRHLATAAPRCRASGSSKLPAPPPCGRARAVLTSGL